MRSSVASVVRIGGEWYEVNCKQVTQKAVLCDLRRPWLLPAKPVLTRGVLYCINLDQLHLFEMSVLLQLVD